jgi:hypothetical protein
MSDLDILVLGDANPDLVLSGGDVVPAFGQAERLVDEARLVIGGSGAIFACGAAKLGLRVAFAGVVGDDMFGRFMCDQLHAHGIDTSAVAVLPERSTGVTASVVVSIAKRSWSGIRSGRHGVQFCPASSFHWLAALNLYRMPRESLWRARGFLARMSRSTARAAPFINHVNFPDTSQYPRSTNGG